MLDEVCRQRRQSLAQNLVEGAEMIDCLEDVIHIKGILRDTDGIRLEDIARLLVGQATSLDVVGIIGQVDLCPMVNPALAPGLHLVLQDSKQRGNIRLRGRIMNSFFCHNM